MLSLFNEIVYLPKKKKKNKTLNNSMAKFSGKHDFRKILGNQHTDETILEVGLFLELEFVKLEFNSILLHSASLPNLSSKNSLIYKIVSNACYVPKFFSKKLLFSKFWHNSIVTLITIS